MIEHTVEGLRWLVIAVHYPSAMQARTAWERAERKTTHKDGGIGIVRLTPQTVGGLASGAPEGVHPVCAVTQRDELAAKVERLLRDGTSWQPSDDFMNALIYRRMRVLLASEGSGRLRIRRPEDRGAEVDPLGNMYEPPAGQG